MNIVICGNYGATNLGDEAILEGILFMARRSVPNVEITVMSANPSETAAAHAVSGVPLFPAGVRSFIRGVFGGTIGQTLQAVSEADLFILGGGGLFTDEKPLAVLIWALQARLARWYKVPIFCFGQSVGPLKTFFGRRAAGNVFRGSQVVTVRDAASADLVKRLEVDDARALADPAFALYVAEPLSERVEPYVVVSVRPWIHGDREGLYKKLAQFVNWMWKEHGLKSVFVPFQMSPDDDRSELNKIFDLLADGAAAEMFEYTSDYRKVMELMARSTAVIGMRLHSLIFSTLARTPFIGLSYSDKVRQFAQEIGMEEYVLDWWDIELEPLQQRLLAILKHRADLVVRLEEAVMTQRSKTLQHEELLRELTTEGGDS